MNEPRRLYTVARANKALALVARIVDDVVARSTELRLLAKRREIARHEELETISRELADQERELDRHEQELCRLGIELKDKVRGLIDFPARAGGRAIYLCWLKGEASVEWWHPVEAGFAGRRSVTELPSETRGE